MSNGHIKLSSSSIHLFVAYLKNPFFMKDPRTTALRLFVQPQ
jgi:hypothetical protein